MPSSITIGFVQFASWPEQLQQEILNRLMLPASEHIAGNVDGPPTPTPETDTRADTDEHFAELSLLQARALVAAPINTKTKAALEHIASNAAHRFRVAELARACGVLPPELSGVWAGITRRTRRLTGDSEAYLIHWHPDPQYGPDGSYVDQTGEIHAHTFQTLRKALNP